MQFRPYVQKNAHCHMCLQHIVTHTCTLTLYELNRRMVLDLVFVHDTVVCNYRPHCSLLFSAHLKKSECLLDTSMKLSKARKQIAKGKYHKFKREGASR